MEMVSLKVLPPDMPHLKSDIAETPRICCLMPEVTVEATDSASLTGRYVGWKDRDNYS